MRNFVNWNDRSPAYNQAVSALETLAAGQGLDIAMGAAAEALAERMRDEPNPEGKPRWSNAHPCIARLLNRRCAEKYCLPSGDPNTKLPPCRPPGADHHYLRLLDGKAWSFETHPYNLNTDDLREMVAFAERWGLDINIDGYSWHFPGHTVHISWRRSGWSEELEKRRQAKMEVPVP